MVLNNLTNDKIYHYTNFTALENVLRTRTLWLSHSSCLNDLSEGVHGLQKILQALKSNSTTKEILDFIESLQHPFEQAIREEGFYVISFCEEGDSLVQWRSYAADGFGVSAGFNVNMLKICCNNTNGYIFGKCSYSDSDNSKSDIFRDIYSQMSASCGTEMDNNLAISIMAITSSFFKHPAFIAEQECRIVSGPRCEQKYRNFNGRIIPYHILNLMGDYSWLKDIWVGPCSQQLSIGKAIEALLEELKIDPKNKIKYSDIPYRGLRNN